MADNQLAIRENMPAPATVPAEFSTEQVLAQVEKIQTLMKAVMKNGEHYGVIPGTPKPTLLKAGAEKLCLMFRLDPQYETRELRDGEHLTVLSTCTLYHIPSGNRMGSGLGSCSTRESKYAYRKAERVCPKCGKDTIRRSKFGNKGWYCHEKAGGCGAQFGPNDAGIANQEVGRVANPDIADQYNTVLKMACKRSLVAAVLNVTAASDIFTQDLEDLGDARRQMTEDSGETSDGGGASGGDHDAGSQEPATITEAQQTMLRAKARDMLGYEDAQLHELAGVQHVSEVRSNALDALLLKIQELGSRPLSLDESFELGQIIQQQNIDPAKVLQFFNKPDFVEFNFAEYNRALRMIRARKPSNGTAEGAPKQAAPAPSTAPAATPSAKTAATGPTISEAQGRRMYAIAKGDGTLLADVLSRYGYSHSRDVKKSEYEEICADIEKAVNA